MRGLRYDRSDHADDEPNTGWLYAAVAVIAVVVVLFAIGWL